MAILTTTLENTLEIKYLNVSAVTMRGVLMGCTLHPIKMTGDFRF
jgi:hypothetical protein